MPGISHGSLHCCSLAQLGLFNVEVDMIPCLCLPNGGCQLYPLLPTTLELFPDFVSIYTFHLEAMNHRHLRVYQVTEIKPLARHPTVLPNSPHLRRQLDIAMSQANRQVGRAFALDPTTPLIYAIAAVGPYWMWSRHAANLANITQTANHIIYELNTVDSALRWEAI